MAPVLAEKKLLGPEGPGGAELPGEEDEGQNLWSSILSEVSTRSRSKLPSGKNILVFGDDGSGKTTLMAKIQGAEHGKKGRGLEYLYLNIHDEDRDDHTRCNVWILDGDLYHKGLLKFAVSAESLQDTIVVFVADMSRPWTVMESLQKWASVLQEHIDKMKIPPEEMRHMEQKFIKEFQEYVEPEEGYQGSPQRRGPSSGQEDEHVSLPLGDNVLTHNLGIPVLVVCTKCDAVSVLEKEHDYREEHFDFIQSHIRRFCLQYGAALIYTSVKEEKNLDLLYKYIVHKTYGFQFTTPALVVEKDAVFIPAGWDNEKKIAILHENFTTVKPEDAYEDFIVKPPVRKLVHDKELAAEDEQVFLMKQQSFLAKQPATPTRASVSRSKEKSILLTPNRKDKSNASKRDEHGRNIRWTSNYNLTPAYEKSLQKTQDVNLKRQRVKEMCNQKCQHLKENCTHSLDKDEGNKMCSLAMKMRPLNKRRVLKDFTAEEINCLLNGVQKMGNHWNLILWSYLFQKGRTSVDLSKKYYRLQVQMKKAHKGHQ